MAKWMHAKFCIRTATSGQCFRDHDVRVKGWLDEPGPVDFGGLTIRPAWLAYPESYQTCDDPAADCIHLVALWQDTPPAGDHACTSDEPYCRVIFPHSAPGTGLHFAPLRRWVILTGHTDDPAAQRCHWEDPADAGGFDEAYAVEACREQFVVTEIDVVDSP